MCELRLPPETKIKKTPWNKGLKMREIWGEELYQKICSTLNREGRPNIGGWNKKDVIAFKNNTIIAVFESSVHAAKRLKLHASLIRKCCRGERKKTGGYQFCYAENEKRYFEIINNNSNE